ncbi:MAG TPA: histidine kinase [Parafilimonas sp.]|nr:histidine kinase [Parafilimonas sp.]
MKTIALIFFTICFNFLQAQEDKLIFKQAGTSFMPTITSRYFYFTRDGLMWFSTANGITSFDGTEFVYYSSIKEATDLGLNDIICIAEDNEHNLYIKGNNHLVYFNRQSNRFSTITYKLNNKPINADIHIASIYIDTEGMVYTGTIAHGLYIYNPENKTCEHLNLNTESADTCCADLYRNTVKSFLPDAVNDSKLWLGTYNGIFLLDKNTGKTSVNFRTNPLIKNTQQSLLPDIRKMDMADDSTIWFSTFSSGMGKYNTHTGLAELYLQNTRINEEKFKKPPTIRGFAKWKNNKYVIGISDPKPGIFNTQTKTFEPFNLNQDPENYINIQYVSSDRDGNVWIMHKGMLYVSVPAYYYLQNTSIKKQLTKDYLANQLGDIFFDKAQSLYYTAVPFSSGVYVLDTNISIKKIIPVPLYTNRYTYKETGNEFITKDGSGRYWTTCLGTYILLPGRNKFEHANEIYPSLSWLKTRGETWGITTTKSGDILLLFVDGTVFHINQHTLQADSITLPGIHMQPAYDITTQTLYYDSLRNKVYLNNQKYIMQYDLTAQTKKIIPSVVLSGTATDDNEKIEYALDARGFIWAWLPRYGIRIIDPEKLACVDSIQNGTRGFLYNNDGFIRSCGDSCMLIIGQEGINIYNYYKKESLYLDDNNAWEHQYEYCKKYSNGVLFINANNQVQYFRLSAFSKINHPVKPVLNYIIANDSIFYTRSINGNLRMKFTHKQNNITLSFSAIEFFFPERIEYAYQLTGVNQHWQYTNFFNRRVSYSALSPGEYTFRIKAQVKGGSWNTAPIEYKITVLPAWWQTTWFIIACIAAACIAAFLVIRWRINMVRNHEQEKAKQQQERSKIEKELLELEAKALRAQMNPHFIFNCMNSIKSLIQQDEKDKATTYLITFSKLIRTIFQNSDKREISLYDEIETCRLYTQLESMRFGNKFSYAFNIDEKTDLKSVMVPALIIQPFIENAIWHGIMPKDNGGRLTVKIIKTDHAMSCIIDDDGIGRDMSKQNKFKGESSSHQSRGVHLTQSRLDLDNLLNERNASVEIIDKMNDNGEATGTKVILVFKEE